MTLYDEIEKYLNVHYPYLEIKLTKETQTKYKIIIYTSECEYESEIDKHLQHNYIKDYTKSLVRGFELYYNFCKINGTLKNRS